MDVVSFDNGSSYTKVYAGESIKAKIPTLETRVEIVDPSQEEFAIEVDGVHYLVGEDARNSTLEGEKNPKIDEKFHGGKAQYVHICYLLNRILAHEKNPSTLVCSLPYSDTRNQDLVKRIVERKHFRWKCAGQERDVNFKNVEVVPQGVGALATTELLHNPDCEIIAVADIGSCTMDVPVLSWHREKKEHIYNVRASFSTRLFNTGLAIEKIRDRLRSLPGCQDRIFDYHMLAGMIEDNRFSFKHKSTIYDDKTVRTIVSEVKTEFTKMFVTEMKKTLKDELWARISQLVIAGGGSYFLDRTDWDCSDRTLWLDEWATVIGQYRGFVS